MDSTPAFPSQKRVHRAGYPTDDFEPVNGMTLRDYFAGKELSKITGTYINDEPAAYARLADHCYRMADAMLKARK